MGVEDKVINFNQESRGILDLQGLSSRYDHVLFDASALISPHKNSKRGSKKFSLKDKFEFYSEIIKYVNRGSNLYITNGIKKELEYTGDGKWLAPSNVKTHCRTNDMELSLTFLKNNRVVDLKNDIKNNNSIEFLNSLEKKKKIYSELRSIYDSLSVYWNLGLSENDRDLVYNAFAGSYSEGRKKSLALVSHDYQLLDFVKLINRDKKSLSLEAGIPALGFVDAKKRIGKWEFASD